MVEVKKKMKPVSNKGCQFDNGNRMPVSDLKGIIGTAKRQTQNQRLFYSFFLQWEIVEKR